MTIRMPLHREFFVGLFYLSETRSFSNSEGVIVVFFHIKIVSNCHQNARGTKFLTNRI
jgi:hypothetical protein